jgi:ankyrin repeat protein
MAARLGHGGVVDVLLKAKASVEVQDRQGQTPLDVARAHHHGAIVKRLGPKTKGQVGIGR